MGKIEMEGSVHFTALSYSPSVCLSFCLIHLLTLHGVCLSRQKVKQGISLCFQFMQKWTEDLSLPFY